MCGLAGLFLPDSSPRVEADIAAMLAVMRHRGPDGTGIHRTGDHRYACGFTRLAIIDLVTGDQPILAEDDVLCGNGEIYNYLELRARCPQWPWRTQGDMEPVLALRQTMGDDFVHELNGMYALALYDGKNRDLLLVRDRLGIKPLYWTRLASGGILFASEIKALFASGLTAPAVDEDAVGSYLSHGYVPGSRTLFRGVNKLPPGHWMRVGADGEVRLHRYWRAAPGTLPAGADAAESLTQLLSDAVRLQLRSDVPVGALLSGGLDSSLMVALAAEQLDRPLHTFTVRFTGAAVDESPLAAMVAERYGTDHQVLDVDAGTIVEQLPRLAWHCDEPLADASVLPNQLIDDVLARHVRVVLNGTGGDELFAGYGRYFQLPVERKWLALPRALRRLAEQGIGLADPMLAWKLGRAELFDTQRGAYVHAQSTLFPPPVLRALGFSGRIAASAQAGAFATATGDAQTKMLVAELETYLVDDLLTLLDRTSMAASVEGRVPFLDHRVVEAALAVPPSVRTKGGKQKALERAMAAPYLPEALLNAPKQGFASPVSLWMLGALAAPARALLISRRALDRGWWSAQGIHRLFARPQLNAPRIYALLMLEMTVRLHVDMCLDSAPTAGLADFVE